MFDCDQNTNAGGPSRAVYGLFANPDALKTAFDDDIALMQLTNCPDGGSSPDSWHYDKTPGVTAGMVACGTYKNHPNVIWTNEAKLVLSDAWAIPRPSRICTAGGSSTADVADRRPPGDPAGRLGVPALPSTLPTARLAAGRPLKCGRNPAARRVGAYGRGCWVGVWRVRDE